MKPTRTIPIPTRFTHCTLRRPIRSYHSTHHPPAPTYPSPQSAILSSALQHVPTHGFTSRALLQGLRDNGYPEVSMQLFPRGVMDLVLYHLVSQREGLAERVQFGDVGKAGGGVGARVRTLARERLRGNRDVVRHWQGALAHMSLLGNIPASLRELHSLADEMWFLAGDTSVDASWYTKRASLAAVYASAELFMTTDMSKDFKETEDFLDRRLEDAQKVGSTLGGWGQFVGFWAGNSVNLARAWGMRI